MISAVRLMNAAWHKRAMQLFLVIVLAHWVEHILQAIQIFLLGWPRPRAGGALGLVYPWLVTSEWLHYGYAVVMLVGLALLRPAFVGRARRWWDVALAIQVWHHFEHLLLFGQATLHQNLFGASVPTSILQLVFPRVELHLFYNAVVFTPMLVAMWYHLYPTRAEAGLATCNSAHPRSETRSPVRPEGSRIAHRYSARSSQRGAARRTGSLAPRM
jgi:hypothetical protein